MGKIRINAYDIYNTKRYNLVILACVYRQKSVLFLSIRACPYFKNGDKNEINRRQTRKIAQVISRYWPAI